MQWVRRQEVCFDKINSGDVSYQVRNRWGNAGDREGQNKLLNFDKKPPQNRHIN